MERPVEKWIRKKWKIPREKEDDVCHPLEQEVKINHYESQGGLVNELEARCDSMSHVQNFPCR